MPDVVLNRTNGVDTAVSDRPNYATHTPQAESVISALTGLVYHDEGTIIKVVTDWINSGVWDELDGLWVFADGQYINWKDPGTYDATENGLIHQIKWNGVKSDESTGYFSLNYNPKQDGVKFTQNDASFGFYCLHGDRSGSARVMGGTDGTYHLTVSPQSSMVLRFNGNAGQVINQAHSYDVLGLWAFNMTSSTNIEWYVGGVKVADINTATSGVPDCDMYAMVLNNNGVANYFCKNIMGMMWFGGAMTAAQILSLQTGMDYLISHQRRLNTDSNIDIFEEYEGMKPYMNSAYRVGTDIYETWWVTTGKGDGTRPAMVRTVNDKGVVSDSYQVISSIAGADDEHIVGYLTIDNNGYIYVAKEYGPNHISPVHVARSDLPMDITGGFTVIDEFTGNYSYPFLLKTGGDIIMVARDNPWNLHTWKKGLEDSSFTDIGSINEHTGGRNYPYAIKNVDEDTVWITLQILGSNPPEIGFNKIFVLKTTDGETWSNVDGSFSKDITIAEISEAELDANFLLVSSVLDDSVFCSGGFIEDGTPKLLVEEGTAVTVGGVEGWRDTDTLAVYHYDGGWVRTQIRTGITILSRHDSYMHNGTYLTYNDDEYIIFSYKDNDNTILEKWTSTDFVTWALDETWLDGGGLKFAWPSNDVQNTSEVGKNMLFSARFDPLMPANIDTFCVENFKRF